MESWPRQITTPVSTALRDIRRFFEGQFSVSPGGQFWMSLDTRIPSKSARELGLGVPRHLRLRSALSSNTRATLSSRFSSGQRRYDFFWHPNPPARRPGCYAGRYRDARSERRRPGCEPPLRLPDTQLLDRDGARRTRFAVADPSATCRGTDLRWSRGTVLAGGGRSEVPPLVGNRAAKSRQSAREPGPRWWPNPPWTGKCAA